MTERYVQVVEPEDLVATALREIESGEELTVAVGDDTVSIEIDSDVEFGHKIALADIPEGETVVKYGKSIGNATEDIDAGAWVHVHNVESNYGRGDLSGDEAEVDA